MHWQQLDPTSLIQDYGTWILPELLCNNRVISLLGLAEDVYLPSKGAALWVLRDKTGRLLHIVAATPRELALVYHPELIVDSSHIVALCQQFTGPWVITCHGQQSRDWEESAKHLSYKNIPLLTTWLYQVDRPTLQSRVLAPELQFLKLAHYSKQIGRFMGGFIQDVLQQRLAEDELRLRFSKQEFYGLLAGDKLLSLAAVTRRSLHSRCISYVYTPARLRGQGYATMASYALTQHLLQQPGIDRIFLYADQSNPCSNHIYQKLGFQMLCEAKTF